LKSIKVCQVTTSKGGGAGIAASRLNYNLNILDNEVTSKLVTKSKKILLNKDELTERSFFSEALSRALYKWLEKDCIKKNTNNYELFSFYKTGYRPNLHEFDIIHLHWISNFIDIKSLLKEYSHKKIIWTLHDLNPFLGGLHYTIDYQRVDESLKSHDMNLSKEKHQLIRGKGIHFNFLSKWLYEEALLYAPWLKDEDVSFSVNGIDISNFRTEGRKEVLSELGMDKKKKNILFISESLSNYRKGIDLLLNVLNKEFCRENNINIYAVGKKDIEKDYSHINFIGRIDSFNELQKYYMASDLFILPSRQDNLPNVMVESLCSGCPVVAFNTGGMKEWINIKNGLLCPEMTSLSLRKTITEAINLNFDREKIQQNALNIFSSKRSSENYSQLYHKLLSTLHK